MITKQTVGIGRTNGPCVDIEVEAEFTPAEIEIVKDTLAMVNKASGNTEGWFIRIDNRIVVPESR
jgi:hypothetical protein